MMRSPVGTGKSAKINSHQSLYIMMMTFFYLFFFFNCIVLFLSVNFLGLEYNPLKSGGGGNVRM